jgi:hypothetical protein
MDKGWMKTARSGNQFAEGVRNFIHFAVDNTDASQQILCPCKLCCSTSWENLDVVNDHLICDGFMPGYTTWVFHWQDVGLGTEGETESGNESENGTTEGEINKESGHNTEGKICQNNTLAEI